jgi:predicted transcriptional regulator
MPTVQKRSTPIKVTVTPEMHARLVALSERFGQSPATIASFALSQYVATQSAALEVGQRVADSFVGSLAPDVRAFLQRVMAHEEAKP